MAKLNPDEVAVVIDDHTGKVRAHFQGLFAGEDARHFLRGCQKGKVGFLSSASVITGQKAEEARKKGRI